MTILPSTGDAMRAGNGGQCTRGAAFDGDAALAAALRDWLANARQRSWRDAIERYFGFGNAPPESAAHPLFWAGFVRSSAAAR